MAAKRAALSINIIADAAQARAGFQEAEKAAGGLQTQLTNVGKAVVGAFATQAVFNFAKSAITAAEESQKADERLRNIAQSMGLFGSEVNTVVERLAEYASTLSRLTGVEDETIKLTQAKLMTFGQLAATAGEIGGAFDRATVAALDMAAAGFGTAESNAVQLGKALNDPIKGITALNKAGITFTADQKAVIESLVDTNRIGEAQALILAEIERQVGGTAAATVTESDKMKIAYGELQESIGNALLPAFNSIVSAITPVVDAFGKLPAGVQTSIAVAGLAFTAFKSLSTSMQGLGMAASTANKALGAVGVVLAGAVAIYSIYNKGKQEAIQNTQDFVTALNAEAGGQEDAVNKHIATILTAEKLSETYGTLGMSIQDVADIVKGEQNPTFDELAVIVEKVRRGQYDVAMANKELGDRFDITFSQAKNFVKEINNQETALAKAREEVAKNEAAQEALGVQTDRARVASEEMTAATEEQTKELQNLLTATLAQFNAALAYESQTWRTEEAIKAYTTAQIDATDKSKNATETAQALKEATNEAAGAALSQAAAAAKLAEDQAKAAGETFTAADAARLQAAELQKVAQTLAPNDPLRRQLQGYIDQLNSIPATKTTQVSIFETTYRTVIEQVQQSRETGAPGVNVSPGAAQALPPSFLRRAEGGPVNPALGPYIVGENGPELFFPGRTGMITPNTSLIDAMASRPTAVSAMGGTTIVVNVAGSVTSERDLVESIRKGLLNAQRSGKAILI